VRRHAAVLDNPKTGRRISPHIFRHTAAMHLLEAGIEVNVIRGWLGHADLTTTNRYAEIYTKAKQQALLATEPWTFWRDTAPTQSGGATRHS
jgi:site-specific recombinase XerD